MSETLDEYRTAKAEHGAAAYQAGTVGTVNAFKRQMKAEARLDRAVEALVAEGVHKARSIFGGRNSKSRTKRLATQIAAATMGKGETESEG